jgi:hemoglobin-like flavoprotein
VSVDFARSAASSSPRLTMVAAALLWTLERGLGEQFTLEVRDAWATVYGLLAATMQGDSTEPLARTA